MSRFLLLMLLVYVPLALAEPVLVGTSTKPQGQGWLVSNKGGCYVLLPNHVVSNNQRRIILTTSAPQIVVNAIVVFRRPEADLALAQVLGGIEGRCGKPWQSLPSDVSRLVATQRSADMVSVNYQGGLETWPISISSVTWGRTCSNGTSDKQGAGDYQYICGAIQQGAAQTVEVFQGLSGSTVLMGDTPIAMVLTAPTATSIKAIRIEEIREPLARWFQQGPHAGRVSTITKSQAQGELPYRVLSTNIQPVSGRYDPSGLETNQGSFAATLDLSPMELIVELGESAPLAVRRVSIAGNQGSDTTSAREAALHIKRDSGSTASWVLVWSGDMPADGSSKTISVNSYAKQARITIMSEWEAGLPVEISDLSFY